MRKKILLAASFLLVVAACSAVSEDPFSGTWRMVESANDAGSLDLLTLSPVEGGMSLQQGDSTPYIAYYGKDSKLDGGAVWNIVRIDDHTLKSTAHSLQNGFVMNETATVSPDGKRYTRIQKAEGSTLKARIEYERVGPVPNGDAFFGTWRPIPETITIKVSQDTINVIQNGQINLSAKLDGKEYEGPVENSKIKARRIDAKTIEVQFDAPGGSGQTNLLNVNGDRLKVTITAGNSGAQGTSTREPVVQEYERIK